VADEPLKCSWHDVPSSINPEVAAGEELRVVRDRGFSAPLSRVPIISIRLSRSTFRPARATRSRRMLAPAASLPDWLTAIGGVGAFLATVSSRSLRLNRWASSNAKRKLPRIKSVLRRSRSTS
jgi:hypothetical protein